MTCLFRCPREIQLVLNLIALTASKFHYIQNEIVEGFPQDSPRVPYRLRNTRHHQHHNTNKTGGVKEELEEFIDQIKSWLSTILTSNKIRANYGLKSSTDTITSTNEPVIFCHLLRIEPSNTLKPRILGNNLKVIKFFQVN